MRDRTHSQPHIEELRALSYMLDRFHNGRGPLARTKLHDAAAHFVEHHGREPSPEELLKHFHRNWSQPLVDWGWAS